MSSLDEGGICLSGDVMWLTLNTGLYFQAFIYLFVKVGAEVVWVEEEVLLFCKQAILCIEPSEKLQL